MKPKMKELIETWTRVSRAELELKSAGEITLAPVSPLMHVSIELLNSASSDVWKTIEFSVTIDKGLVQPSFSRVIRVHPPASAQFPQDAGKLPSKESRQLNLSVRAMIRTRPRIATKTVRQMYRTQKSVYQQLIYLGPLFSPSFYTSLSPRSG